MKISNILNERSGVIKAPREAIDSVMNVVCSDFFSRAITYLNQLGDDYVDLLPVYSKLLGVYRKKYGHFGLYSLPFDQDTDGQTYIRMADVDPRYFNRNKDSKHRTYRMNVKVSVSNAETKFAATYGKKSAGVPATVNVWLPDEDHLKVVIKSPEILTHTLERVEGYIEHELMHAVQDMALKQHDDTEASYVDGELDTEKYYTSGIEFSPQILTAGKDFVANIKEFQSLGVTMTKEKIRSYLSRYINPDAPRVAGVDLPDSEFFHVLFKKDKAKWKKAIKGFYGLVQKELKL